jgi:hypothetical protein
VYFHDHILRLDLPVALDQVSGVASQGRKYNLGTVVSYDTSGSSRVCSHETKLGMTDAERKEGSKCRVDVGPRILSTPPDIWSAIDVSYLLAPFNSASSATARTRGTFSVKLSCARVATKRGSVLPLVESDLSPMYLSKCYKTRSTEFFPDICLRLCVESLVDNTVLEKDVVRSEGKSPCCSRWCEKRHWDAETDLGSHCV